MLSTRRSQLEAKSIHRRLAQQGSLYDTEDITRCPCIKRDLAKTESTFVEVGPEEQAEMLAALRLRNYFGHHNVRTTTMNTPC